MNAPKHYFDVITKICKTHHVTDFKNLLVIGDIFELDLALPLTLGGHVALMTNEHTPDYEKEFISSHSQGNLISNLREATNLIQET